MAIAVVTRTRTTFSVTATVLSSRPSTGQRFPERKLTFLNRGISGNKVTDLAARWQKDALDLKPDVLSILIGINDSGHIPLEEYEQIYDKLLVDAKAANPNIHFILCEPFYLPKDGRKEGDERDQDIKKRQAIVAKLAGKHQAALVKFQKVFDDACKRAPAQYWVWDAVHPTYSGHQLMADEWIRTASQFKSARCRITYEQNADGSWNGSTAGMWFVLRRRTRRSVRHGRLFRGPLRGGGRYYTNNPVLAPGPVGSWDAGAWVRCTC